jgi:hypothetical protein
VFYLTSGSAKLALEHQVRLHQALLTEFAPTT